MFLESLDRTDCHSHTLTDRATIEKFFHFFSYFLWFKMYWFYNLTTIATPVCHLTTLRIECRFPFFSKWWNINKISIRSRHIWIKYREKNRENVTKSKYIFYTTSSVRYLLLFQIQRERTCPRKKAIIAIKNAKKCAGIKNISSFERKNSTEIQVPTPKNIERRALIVCTFLYIRAITSGTNAPARVIL